MAKVTLVVEDGLKDGKSVINGRFDTEGQDPGTDKTPGFVSNAQLYMATIQRLWDAGTINTLVKICCPDLFHRNDVVVMTQRQATQNALRAAAGAAGNLDTAPEDAVVLPGPDGAPLPDKTAPPADAPAA